MMDGGLFNETDSEEEEREARVLAAVDVLPGPVRYQPAWFTGGLSATARSAPTSYLDELNRERLHSRYLAVMQPVLSPHAEASLWAEAAQRRLNVTRVQNPTVAELRRSLPAARKQWYFDDSDDEAEDAKREVAAAAAKAAARLAAAAAQEAARRQARVHSMLSASQASWGDDSDTDGESSGSDAEPPPRGSSPLASSGGIKASKANPPAMTAVVSEDNDQGGEKGGDWEGELPALSTKERAKAVRQKSAERAKKAKAKAAAAARVHAAQAALDDGDDNAAALLVGPDDAWAAALKAYFVAAEAGAVEAVAEGLEGLEVARARWRTRAEQRTSSSPACAGAPAVGASASSEAAASAATAVASAYAAAAEPDLPPAISATGCCVDAVDSKGFTALHWACDQGHDALCSWLVRHAHATLDLPDPLGLTPLHVAACSGGGGRWNTTAESDRSRKRLERERERWGAYSS
jgi:hypothetical protein